MTTRAITATLLLALAATLLPMGVSAAQPTAESQRWIVQLAPGASPAGVLASSDRSRSVRPTHLFQRALRGFAARLTSDQRIALLADPRVVAVVPDRPIRATADLAQAVPSGVRRVGARANPDAGPGTLDVDIAVVDTVSSPTIPTSTWPAATTAPSRR